MTLTPIRDNPPGVAGASGRALRLKILPLAAAIAISAVAIWFSAGFTREAPIPPAEAPGMKVENDTVTLEPDAPQWKTLKLGAASAATVTWSDKIPARIQIDQGRASRVGSPLGGRVTNVNVELGQRVRAGDPLFTVTSPEIAALKSEQEKTNVELSAARTTCDRVKAMVDARALPAKEEVAARQQLAEAELAAKLTASKLGSLRVSSLADNEFTVAAPREGLVVEKNVLPGQEVQSDSSSSLVTIADLSEVWVVADLFEADWTQVRVGAPARVTLPYLPGATLEATVDAASAVVDPVRHTVPIRLRLKNVDGSLRPNSYAEVRLSIRPPDGAVEVASSSLVSDGARQYVMMQGSRGRFTRREVVAGAASGDRVVVLSGLKPGDVVAEEGAVLLENQLVLSD
jgi:cobalt-zinc-cadmium efflux system membrane fusion protein